MSKADSPTVTMQRIKAITTGNIPSFFDVKNNFNAMEINEDNIIEQLLKHNKTISFYGDDTWTNMYPNHFRTQYPFDSFNVNDIETVDNGI